MKIKLSSVLVDDQAKALKFYTEVFPVWGQTPDVIGLTFETGFGSDPKRPPSGYRDSDDSRGRERSSVHAAAPNTRRFATRTG